MACEQIEGGFVCGARYTDVRLLRFYCPTCGKDTWSVVSCAEWYGREDCCLRCGERWGEGMRAERPFIPGWREKSKAQARKLWKSAAATA